MPKLVYAATLRGVGKAQWQTVSTYLYNVISARLQNLSNSAAFFNLVHFDLFTICTFTRVSTFLLQ